MPKRRDIVEALSEKEKYENSLSSLEELKAKGEVSEEQYNSLKEEYEKRITENKIKIEQLKKDLELEVGSKKTEKNTLEKQRENLETRVKVGEIRYDVSQKEKRKLDRQIERQRKEIANLQMLLSAEKASDIRGEVETVAKSVEDLEPSQIDLADVIVSPFRLLSEHYNLFIPLGISAGIALILAIVGFGAAMTMDPSALIGYGISTLIASIVIFLMGGWVIAMMREIKKSGETTPESSFSILMENIVPIILGAVLAGLIVMAGIIALVIPGLILAVALCCTVPAIVMHKFDAVDGLKASWKFCWQGKNFWRLLALFLIMALVSWIPFLGSVIQAFILPLWIPYAYMEYVGVRRGVVSGINVGAKGTGITKIGGTTARKMIKVILPLMEGYAFPNICPGCLRQADTSVEVGYTRMKHYVVVKKYETSTIEVPTCGECARRFKSYKIITNAVLLGGVMIGVLFGMFGNFGAGFALIIVAIVSGIVYARLYNPLGFFFKVNRKKGIAEFSIKNPGYAELFKEANMSEKEAK